MRTPSIVNQSPLTSAEVRCTGAAPPTRSTLRHHPPADRLERSFEPAPIGEGPAATSHRTAACRDSSSTRADPRWRTAADRADTPFTTLNIAVVAPMLSASVSTTVGGESGILAQRPKCERRVAHDRLDRPETRADRGTPPSPAPPRPLRCSAARRASLGVIPRRTCSSVAICRCASNSSATSRPSRPPPTAPRKRAMQAPHHRDHVAPRPGARNSPITALVACPRARLARELLAAGLGQR